MYSAFRYESLPLVSILLDDRNPRLVTRTKLSRQNEILSYLYAHEELDLFIRKIASEGHNRGAERPYVIKSGSNYLVIEGNTRIAAYKVLTGLLKPPSGYSVPHAPEALLKKLVNVECTIAPNREAVMPIMANAHFGLGDKSRWKFLSSRKVIYDEWKNGNNLATLAKVFDVKLSAIKDFILEYMLYEKALSYSWKKQERERLLDPAVAFNPPIRFLQSSGHKEKMGIRFDSTNLSLIFEGDADDKFKHLLQKLVITPTKGLGATASYEAVFADYKSKLDTNITGGSARDKSGDDKNSDGKSRSNSTAGADTSEGKSSKEAGTKKRNALFSYHPKVSNALVAQLMKEAKDLDSKKFPASATFLLRNIVESVLKHIIDDQRANTSGEVLSLEKCLDLCKTNRIDIHVNDKKILKEFHKDHLTYLNLGAHGIIIPNADRLAAARDCIDQFIKKHV